MHRTWYVATLKKDENPLFLEYFIEHLCLNCFVDSNIDQLVVS